MKQFEIGATYYCRSICDYNCIFTITVAKRTAKTITTTEGKRLGIVKDLSAHNNAETVRPHGNYAMCATINAGSLFDSEARRPAC